ncbi:hypothetical protein [Enterovirga rhinocerotis]|uniref:Uncharacterized protein n=1 Tax=Enterovirga rhinocerotis TaxID=1339210 RepID=A0A4R7C1K7_9HYPH|nr:hypothetical protein [Enterovirga rhinocerotis]TDR90266.1 hypothetical protein EV668_3112 [Enterovirga rhinocerotis]
MTSMIEVVARAICVPQGVDPDQPVADDYVDEDGVPGSLTIPAWQNYAEEARAAIEAMAADIRDEEISRAAGQWAFRLAYTSKPQPLNEFEAGYRMGAKREGASLLEADAARAALEGERDGG